MSLIKNVIRLSSRNSLYPCISFVNICPKFEPPGSLACVKFLQKAFHTGFPRRFNDCPKFKAFKAKQAKMQCDDGYPVYLKGGLRDKILYHFTVGACVIGLAQCFWLFYVLAKS